MSKAYALFEAGLKQRLERFAYPQAFERFALAISDTEHIAVPGAAALYLDVKS